MSDVDIMLSTVSKKQIRRLNNPRSLYKLQRMLTKEFCIDCRDLAFRNSKRPYSDYCSDCQKVATKVLEGIMK